MLERSHVVATIAASEAASVSTRFAVDVAQSNSLDISYQTGDSVAASESLLSIERHAAGQADATVVQLSGRHPAAFSKHWYLLLPGDTPMPLTLPELRTQTMQTHWPSDQIAALRVVVSQYAYDQLDFADLRAQWWASPPPAAFGAPTCSSKIATRPVSSLPTVAFGQ